MVYFGPKLTYCSNSSNPVPRTELVVRDGPSDAPRCPPGRIEAIRLALRAMLVGLIIGLESRASAGVKPEDEFYARS